LAKCLWIATFVNLMCYSLIHRDLCELDEWSVLAEQLAECLVIMLSPTNSIIMCYSLICRNLCELDDWSVLKEQLAECLGFVPTSWPLYHVEFCVPCNLSCLISDVHVHFYQTPICVVHLVTILVIKPLENETSELDE
jgi:hypothetical protein